MQRVVVLGASGMLGAMTAQVLAGAGFAVKAVVRGNVARHQKHAPLVSTWATLDAETCTAQDIATVLDGYPWAINAIGVIKPYVHDDDPDQVERAIRVNSLFPHALAKVAETTGCRVLQIATDCAYSGHKGGYVEADPHDPLDVYGKTKSLGECRSPQVHHLRCSIVGPELKSHRSLLDWFLGQPKGAQLNGFTNHDWNGVTTLHFAKACAAIIERNVEIGPMQHLVPGDRVSKLELLRCFAVEFERTDLVISETKAATALDRTLGTTNEIGNRDVWTAAGYSSPPTIAEMVRELAQTCPRFSEVQS